MTKCAAFWKHTNVRSNNRIFPCCRFKKEIGKFDGDLANVLHIPEYEELRKKSMSGEFIDGCQKCYYEESIGKTSLRQKFNSTYSTDSVSLEYFEVGFDNICNLTCDGCWEDFSTAWGKKLNLNKTFIVKSTTEILNIPESVNKVLFLGGEPLMTTRHKKFLKMVPNLDNLHVIYNTNGTFMLDSETIELLQKCKKVEFIVSIDGYKEINETVRSGSKWEDILNFINQLKTYNFLFTIHTVIHLNNWEYLGDLSNFIYENSYTWSINILTHPKNLDIKNYHDKEKIVQLINNINIPDKQHIISHLLH